MTTDIGLVLFGLAIGAVLILVAYVSVWLIRGNNHAI